MLSVFSTSSVTHCSLYFNNYCVSLPLKHTNPICAYLNTCTFQLLKNRLMILIKKDRLLLSWERQVLILAFDKKI